MANTTKVMSQMKRFFEKREIPYTSEQGVLWGMVSGDATQWQWVIRLCDQGSGIVSLRAGCPVKVTAQRRAAAAEYLMRANWDLNFGNFQMDWEDGEVSFRTSIPASASGVSIKAMTDLFYGPCMMMDHYLPGLLAVAVGNQDPAKAAAAADIARSLQGQEGGAVEEDAEAEASAEVPDETGDERATRLGRLFGGEN
jgi:hypothetical protein